MKSSPVIATTPASPTATSAMLAIGVGPHHPTGKAALVEQASGQ